MKIKLNTIVFICSVLCNNVTFSQTKKLISNHPPMGWNSWNHFKCDGLNETVVKEVADSIVANGMKDAGYEYIVLDDCWQIARDEKGKIIVDSIKFPSGIKALADYIHNKGLKFGLYSCAGRKTCQERPGSFNYEEIDAKTYEEWGVDFLKYDWCHSTFLDPEETYARMGKALAELQRPIFFSICNWGRKDPWKWAGKFAHMWRTTDDIIPCFDCADFIFQNTVVEIIDKQADLNKYAGPNCWNDPDMLEIGNGTMTNAENRAHFSLWCMMAAPLMAGNDLRNMKPDILKILTNKIAISIDQDEMGKQGYKIKDDGNHEIWFKPIENNQYAVCFFNRGNLPWNFKEVLKDLGVMNFNIIENAWNKGKVTIDNGIITSTVGSHDVLLLKFKIKNNAI